MVKLFFRNENYIISTAERNILTIFHLHTGHTAWLLIYRKSDLFFSHVDSMQWGTLNYKWATLHETKEKIVKQTVELYSEAGINGNKSIVHHLKTKIIQNISNLKVNYGKMNCALHITEISQYPLWKYYHY